MRLPQSVSFLSVWTFGQSFQKKIIEKIYLKYPLKKILKKKLLKTFFERKFAERNFKKNLLETFFKRKPFENFFEKTFEIVFEKKLGKQFLKEIFKKKTEQSESGRISSNCCKKKEIVIIYAVCMELSVMGNINVAILKLLFS